MKLTKNKLVSLPKIDAHNHLNLGMRYAAYSAWAGFKIPNFPRKFNGLEDMHTIIAEYTRPRQKTARDVDALLSMAIDEAIRDGVTVLEGSVDIGFVIQCEGVDKFLALVCSLKEKYAKKIAFLPELGMGKLFEISKINAWAPACLKSGLFKSIDLYGPEVEDGIESFKGIYELAGKLGIKKKAHVGEFSDAASVRRFVEFFELDEVQHGIGAVVDDSALQFLRDKNIRCNVCPESNVALSAVSSLAEHPVKRLIEAGVRVSIGTDDVLFFDRSVSEQCWDLIEAGTLTGAQIASVLESNISEYS
ncbi:MAG: adenosine deaminase [Treponemataceae bacterium]|nr:MAG: adenosine deaminase [Treponemataceae bacterium]